MRSFQAKRLMWEPALPGTLTKPMTVSVDESVTSEVADAAALGKLFPHTWGQKFVKLARHAPMNVGVVLSGGQAAGGHNVIAGVFDYVKRRNPESKVYGFKNGPHGLFTANYMELTPEYVAKYRNMGGFDMICSGRHKIETEEQKQASMKVCQDLKLDGVVIIGGDDSNTNGAVLAEYFKEKNCSTVVAGCPKTIDGDLKNEYIEISFGFDTAIKVYSELVGNLCVDAATHKNTYYFVRLMGRSATNIGLEVAMQTRANLSFVGEEIQAENRSLSSICNEIADMIVARHNLGKDYGVVLLPEGLIEFIPEVGTLISEINEILGDGNTTFDKAKLSAHSLAVFESLPDTIRAELLLERDSHGNVQVAKIATERLLILMTKKELANRGYNGPFFPIDHYFGYEGRCANPSNFDANYCYALGHTAGALVDNKLTGYMAVVRNLSEPSSEWCPGGCPVTIMMNLERRKGKDVPVIKKYLVELDQPLFQTFKKVREAWKTDDYYRCPGPIQFDGPNANVTNFMISPPTEEFLLSKDPKATSPGTSNLAYERKGARKSSLVSPLTAKAKRVCVMLAGRAVPGVANIVIALSECVEELSSASLTNFAKGKVEPVKCVDCLNQGGYPWGYGEFDLSDAAGIKKTAENYDSVVVIVTDSNDKKMMELSNVLKDKLVAVPVNTNLACSLGYDTLTRTYASIIGNLLTDAASATKYWYFVKVGGDQRMCEKLAKQTNADVVAPEGCLMDAVDTVAQRIADKWTEKKNFGVVLVPETLCKVADPQCTPAFYNEALKAPTPSGKIETAQLPIDQAVAAMVNTKLKATAGYDAPFAPVCYSLGVQCRCALPSDRDSDLGLAVGHLAGEACSRQNHNVKTCSEHNTLVSLEGGAYTNPGPVQF